MKQKINIAQLLKDCPQGMELDCAMYDNLYFDEVDTIGCIKCYIKSKDDCLTRVTFHENGCYNTISNAKCVIFPKGKTTWEGFVPPIQFKDGDVVSTKNGHFIGIIKVKNNMQVGAYCAINDIGTLAINVFYGFERLATEEEKQKLFDAIKANGYKWNPETKTLEKLPNFKVGDRIKKKGIDDIYAIEITAVTKTIYTFKNSGFKYVDSTDKDYELVPNK